MDYRLLGAGQAGVDGEGPMVIALVSHKPEEEEAEVVVVVVLVVEEALGLNRQRVPGCDPRAADHYRQRFRAADGQSRASNSWQISR